MNILKELDTNQFAAATAPDGCVLVSAGAGTGKTKTLTARILYLILEKNIPSENIMAVTFTNKAAREIKERVKLYVGDKANNLLIGTFHSLSCKFLRKYYYLAGLKSSFFNIIDTNEQVKFLEQAVIIPDSYGSFNKNSFPTEIQDIAEKEWKAGLKEFVSSFSKQLSLWKSWGLSDFDITDPNRKKMDDLMEKYASAYVNYQYELEQKNCCDFGDLILKVVNIFKKHEDILSIESQNIKYMLVDEGQDANPVQVEWVKLLTSYNKNLFVVGDEDQNIYGFQGGYNGAMLDMVGEYFNKYELVLNRRCTEQILYHANLPVDYNKRKSPKILKSNINGDPVIATSHVNEIIEAKYIANEIKELLNTGVSPFNIVVLVRSSWIIPPIEEALIKNGIPSVISSGVSLLDREEVKDILSYLKLSIDPFNEMAFLRIANKPSRGIGPTIVEIINETAKRENVNYSDACHIVSTKVKKIKQDAREGISSLGRCLSLLAQDGENSRHPYDIVNTAIRDTGYLDWLLSLKDGEKKSKNIDILKRLSNEYEDIVNFIYDLSLLNDLDAINSEIVDNNNKVRISTMHSVKGLEFDYVFCPGFDYGVMPSQKSLDSGVLGKYKDKWNGLRGGGLEEERRLAHVAFTRAKKKLYVSFPWKRSNMKFSKNKNIGGPSSFIEECEFLIENNKHQMSSKKKKNNFWYND